MPAKRVKVDLASEANCNCYNTATSAMVAVTMSPTRLCKGAALCHSRLHTIYTTIACSDMMIHRHTFLL